MFSIRMAIRQVKKITQLVRNVKPIMYPASSMLFAYSIFFYKRKKDKELELEPHELIKLKHKQNLEQKIKLVTEDVIRSAFKTVTISFKLMFILIVEYRIILEKLISVHQEILAGDISDTKTDTLLKLQRELQTKRRQILAIQNYIYYIQPLISSATQLNFVFNGDIKVEQEMWNKLREELKNISQLEQVYWQIQKQNIEKTKKTNLKILI